MLYCIGLLLKHLYRTVPGEEVDAASTFMEALLACRIRQLPTEWLTHSFWRMFSQEQSLSSKDFIECLQADNITIRVQRSESCGSPVKYTIFFCYTQARYAMCF